MLTVALTADRGPLPRATRHTKIITVIFGCMGEPTLRQQLARSRRRYSAAAERYRDADKAMRIEKRRIGMIEALLRAGPGHVFTPMGDPADRFSDPDPHCRHCGLVAGCISADNPCQGDQHICPAIVPAGSDGAKQVYGCDDWCCWQPGTMAEDFTSWTCVRGHVTSMDHVPLVAGLRRPMRVRHESVCALVGIGIAGCPWRHLLEAA